VIRRLVQAKLARITDGELEIRGGPRLGRPAADGLRAVVEVRRERTWRRILLGGALGASESYVDGDWTTDDIPSVVRLLVRNAQAQGDGVTSRAAAIVHGVTRRNSRAGSRRNIADHYDLGNDFFALMLDPTMTYSSAIFEDGDDDLERASVRKLERLCAKLELRPDDHLLEIGGGWGSLAIHAAARHGCRVTTTTISAAQQALATERVRAAGLADRVRVLGVDYRDLTGSYSKIVSCEMIEAIGADQVPGFFAICDALLAPGGRLVLQAITIADHAYERARREVDFVKRHVFPGSCIPSVTSLCAATGASRLRLRALDEHGAHYARTLAAWRRNLRPHERAVILRHGERFWRLWTYYLGYCEAGFRERYLSGVQLVYDR
jgi:cyclopropane-fatty-acyl-phospholipid synthase